MRAQLFDEWVRSDDVLGGGDTYGVGPSPPRCCSAGGRVVLGAGWRTRARPGTWRCWRGEIVYVAQVPSEHILAGHAETQRLAQAARTNPPPPMGWLPCTPTSSRS